MSGGASSTVGIIVNPHAGKDIRRLVSAAGHTSDAVKIGIVRRAVIGSFEQGASRVLLSLDSHRLCERAVNGLIDDLSLSPDQIEFVESPGTGSRLDTVAVATSMWKADVGAVIALGGDGTCRDVSCGWPDAPLIAVSTGTNNVYPTAIDGTTAGVAAALVATGVVDADSVTSRSKRVMLTIDDPADDTVVHDESLVEAALIDATFVGARAVSDPSSIRWVVACLADPASTGLSSIAGRLHPVAANERGGVALRFGPGGRRVRVPLAPGSFATLEVASVESIAEGATVSMPGGGVLAYDGERTTPVSNDATVSVSIDAGGPRRIDVDATLALAAAARRFDADPSSPSKGPHGD